MSGETVIVKAAPLEACVARFFTGHGVPQADARLVANALVQADAARLQVEFIDIFAPMLDAQGQPREELFLPDRLHMNAAGYEVWKQAIRPYLDRDAKP